MNGAVFLYIDYGGSPLIARELRYSLATLLCEIRDARVVVYTDDPARCADLHPGVSARPFGADLARWSRGGAYNHRVKPCVLADALAAHGGVCALLDTDSYICEGFAAALAARVSRGPVMDVFERADPYPEIAGFAARLPRAGAYVYDSGSAVMFNSGLVAADARRDLAAVEDAIALIDALWDADRRRFNIEQIAFSEAFRLQGAPVGEMAPLFVHYCRRSLKRYMHWRLKSFARRPLAPARPSIKHPHAAVRAFNWVQRIGGGRA